MRDLPELVKALQNDGRSSYDIAEEIGLHRNSVYGIMTGRKEDPRYSTLKKIDEWVTAHE